MFLSKLDKFRDFGLLLLRLGIGTMFILHGHPKMFGGVETWERLGLAVGNFGIHYMPAFWGFMSAFAEFCGGILLILGLLSRPACILLALNMIVASKMHLVKGDGIMGASHAIELAILFISLIVIGPGKFSIDAKIK